MITASEPSETCTDGCEGFAPWTQRGSILKADLTLVDLKEYTFAEEKDTSHSLDEKTTLPACSLKWDLQICCFHTNGSLNLD